MPVIFIIKINKLSEIWNLFNNSLLQKGYLIFHDIIFACYYGYLLLILDIMKYFSKNFHFR